MSIILIIIFGLITLALGIIGYIEKLIRKKPTKRIYLVLLLIFITISIGQISYSLYSKLSSESQISELELKTNAIQSIQIRFDLETTNAKNKGNNSYIGLTNQISLLTKSNIAYHFVNTIDITSTQISENVTRLNFIYEPQDPTELYGRTIGFLKDINVFVCDYSSFLLPTESKLISNSFDITIFINGIDVIAIHNNVTSGVLERGQAMMDLSNEFTNIEYIYSEKLKIKNTGK